MRRRIQRRVWLLVLPLAAACATVAAPPAEPGPEPAVAGAGVGFSLVPDAAALRTAERVELTGLELGTMWTFEEPPLEYWRDRYEFRPTAEWLDHVRLSSLRFGEVCSAAFVSPDGLAVTNHHCARTCIEAASSPGRDFLVDGFNAARRQEERLCPEMWLDQLVGVEDVTARVLSALPSNASPQNASDVLSRTQDEIRAECEREADACQVVSLYQGGRYHLYRYERYPAVKLVFAPELQAGFFGGDPDNFTYPRYALDVSFVRAYEADGVTPVRTRHYLKWRPEGAAEGELVFVAGNPGSTSRLITVAQLMYERLYRHPFIIQLFEGERVLLTGLVERDPDVADDVRQDLFEVENGLKAFRGQLVGLRDTLLVGTKVRWERALRERIEGDAELAAKYGDVWSRLEEIQRQKLEVAPRVNAANLQLVGGPHFAWANSLLEYVEESARPVAQRSAEFRRREMQIEAMLTTQAPIDEEYSLASLALHIDIARTWLDAADPLLAALLQPGETPVNAARRLAASSKILDASFRRWIMAGGPDAVAASDDPVVRFARQARREYTALRTRWLAIVAAEAVQRRRLAQATFAAYGTALPPDATFTPRISDGVVQRYAMNGTYAPPVTTMYGLYARAAEFGNEMPWTLPDAFERARYRVRMSTPLNFVSTADITGGNSGSPVIDREGRIVGVVFDSNVEQLPDEFLYRPGAGRTIAVHVAGILEALRSVYHADALLHELLDATGTTLGSSRDRRSLN